jgi:hypothetical protein
MTNYARGPVRAKVMWVDGEGKILRRRIVRIKAPTKIRDGVRVMDMSPEAAAHLGVWLLQNVPFIKEAK